MQKMEFFLLNPVDNLCLLFGKLAVSVDSHGEIFEQQLQKNLLNATFCFLVFA